MRKAGKALVLGLIVLALSSCSFNVSTANLSGVKVCTALKDGVCAKDQATFAPDTPEIFVSTLLSNAPDGTKLTFSWKYLEGKGVDIDSVEVETKNGENTAQSSLSKPTQGWPAGRYEVVLKLGTDNSEPFHKKFQVAPAQ